MASNSPPSNPLVKRPLKTPFSVGMLDLSCVGVKFSDQF